MPAPNAPIEPIVLAALVGLVREHGHAGAAARLSLSKATIVRALAGCAVSPLVRTALARELAALAGPTNAAQHAA